MPDRIRLLRPKQPRGTPKKEYDFAEIGRAEG